MKRDLRPRHDTLTIPTSDDLRALYVHAQYTASRILAHGASDRAEVDALARMCDVPTHVVRLAISDAA